jgi:ribonuclease D
LFYQKNIQDTALCRFTPSLTNDIIQSRRKAGIELEQEQISDWGKTSSFKKSQLIYAATDVIYLSDFRNS